MAIYSRPVIADVACKDKDSYSICHHKFQYLTGISWEFDSPYEEGCDDRILVKNALGHSSLVVRSLDGRRGYIDYSAAPYPAGKCRISYVSKSKGLRRARVVLWVGGERVDFESM